MKTSTLSSFLLLHSAAYLLPVSLISASRCGRARLPSKLPVRLPPYLDPALNASNTCLPSNAPSFEAPPLSFFAGTWYVTNSSRAQYRTFSNLQWDLWPVVPSCVQNTTAICPPGTVAGMFDEITTWSPSENTTANFGAIGGGGRSVASIRAYDTPRRLNFPDLNSDWDAVFDNKITEGVPAGFSETWSVIYWGLDTDEMPYMIVHEDLSTLGTGEVGPPCVDAISRNPAGPVEKSLTDVLKALVDLGNRDLTELIGDLGPVKWDHGLEGGPAICDTQCMGNQPT